VYGHPHAETIAALEMIMGDASRILRTDREGTVEFEIDAEGLRRIGGRGQGLGIRGRNEKSKKYF
jgi:beta-lactamase superfamily II metal-dependent hydrolase